MNVCYGFCLEKIVKFWSWYIVYFCWGKGDDVGGVGSFFDCCYFFDNFFLADNVEGYFLIIYIMGVNFDLVIYDEIN